MPRTKLPEVLRRIDELSREHGLRVGNVFHAGDGNLHPLVLYDAGRRARPRRRRSSPRRSSTPASTRAARSPASTASASTRRARCRRCSRSATSRRCERLRRAFDPDGLANPGKVFPTPRLCGEVPGPVPRHPLELVGPCRASLSLEQAVGRAARPRRPRARTRADRHRSRRRPASTAARARGRRPDLHRRGRDPALGAAARARARTASGSRSTRPATRRSAPASPATSPGPLRHRFGAPRDLVLGVTLVLADGTVASSGGKVVKNVAGYDLGKLFCGSQGRLGVHRAGQPAPAPAPRPPPRPSSSRPTTPPPSLRRCSRSQLVPSARRRPPPRPGRAALRGRRGARSRRRSRPRGRSSAARRPTAPSGTSRARVQAAAPGRASFAPGALRRFLGARRRGGRPPGRGHRLSSRAVTRRDTRAGAPARRSGCARAFDPGGRARVRRAPDVLRSLTSDCVHCGFCLPTCPTYLLWSEEMDSPRGRIQLMEALLDGTIALNPTVVGALRPLPRLHGLRHLVPVGRPVRPADRGDARDDRDRDPAPARRPASARRRSSRSSRYPRRMRPALRLAPLGRKLPLPGRLGAMTELAPPWRSTERPRGATPARGETRGRVGLLTGCVQCVVFGRSTPRRRACSPPTATRSSRRRQGCCGALVDARRPGRGGRAPSRAGRSRRSRASRRSIVERVRLRLAPEGARPRARRRSRLGRARRRVLGAGARLSASCSPASSRERRATRSTSRSPSRTPATSATRSACRCRRPLARGGSPGSSGRRARRAGASAAAAPASTTSSSPTRPASSATARPRTCSRRGAGLREREPRLPRPGRDGASPGRPPAAGAPSDRARRRLDPEPRRGGPAAPGPPLGSNASRHVAADGRRSSSRSTRGERREEPRPARPRSRPSATPPITTAGTAPTSAAATPDSNAPSSFEALMNTISTAFTRPRSSSGVDERQDRLAQDDAHHVDGRRRPRARAATATSSARARRRRSRRRRAPTT